MEESEWARSKPRYQVPVFSFAASESGIGLIGAFGHEWRLTQKFALGPQLEFSWMDVGDEVTANFFNLTLAANWYF